MKCVRTGVAMVFVVFAAQAALTAEAPAKRKPKEALQVFNDLIGSWRGTGTPEGTQEEKRKGFWTESISWSWHFKGEDAWLTVTFEKGKYFTNGELRYLPATEAFQLTLHTPAKEALTFDGKIKDRILTLTRTDAAKKETQQIVLSLLHSNRYVYRYEVKPQERLGFNKLYQVGATKEGVPFATGDSKPECIVSGGLGTMAVTYKGQTYYVCCSGCRDAFKDDPEKYIKEYEAKKAKEKNR
jgi:hypothetical protein